jgi:hypothetical protein
MRSGKSVPDCADSSEPHGSRNVNQKIDAKISNTSSPNNPGLGSFDLKTELEKLDKMKKDGLITDDEFKLLRQRAIDKAKVQ